MTELIRYALSNGGSVVVALGDVDRASMAGFSEQAAKLAAASLREALAPVVGAASDVAEAFRKLQPQPDGLEVKFGVTLDGKLGGVIAHATAGVQFEVTLHWNP